MVLASTHHLAGTPGADTLLPGWTEYTRSDGTKTYIPEQLADITLEELIAYYPDHLFRWPGLALLYRHSSQDTHSPLFYTKIAFKIAGFRENSVGGLAGNNIKYWVNEAIRDLIPDYSDGPGEHVEKFRARIMETGQTWIEFLNEHLWDAPKRWSRYLKPPIALAEVGLPVRVHPRGRFSERVQNAMRGWSQPEPKSLGPDSIHPLIQDLIDKSKRWNLHLELTEVKTTEGKRLNLGRYPINIPVLDLIRYHHEDCRLEVLLYVMTIYSAEDIWRLSPEWRAAHGGGHERFQSMIKSRKTVALGNRAVKQGKSKSQVKKEFDAEMLQAHYDGRRANRPGTHRDKEGRIEDEEESDLSSVRPPPKGRGKKIKCRAEQLAASTQTPVHYPIGEERNISNGPIHYWMMTQGWIHNESKDGNAWFHYGRRLFLNEQDNSGILWDLDVAALRRGNILCEYNMGLSSPSRWVPTYGLAAGDIPQHAVVSDEEWALDNASAVLALTSESSDSAQHLFTPSTNHGDCAPTHSQGIRYDNEPHTQLNAPLDLGTRYNAFGYSHLEPFPSFNQQAQSQSRLPPSLKEMDPTGYGEMTDVESDNYLSFDEAYPPMDPSLPQSLHEQGIDPLRTYYAEPRSIETRHYTTESHVHDAAERNERSPGIPCSFPGRAPQESSRHFPTARVSSRSPKVPPTRRSSRKSLSSGKSGSPAKSQSPLYNMSLLEEIQQLHAENVAYYSDFNRAESPAAMDFAFDGFGVPLAASPARSSKTTRPSTRSSQKSPGHKFTSHYTVPKVTENDSGSLEEVFDNFIEDIFVQDDGDMIAVSLPQPAPRHSPRSKSRSKSRGSISESRSRSRSPKRSRSLNKRYGRRRS
jgi:hypothetical protein